MFVKLIEQLAPLILSAENLPVKSIAGKKITVTDLRYYIKEYSSVLEEGKIPKVDVLLQVYIHFNIFLGLML